MPTRQRDVRAVAEALFCRDGGPPPAARIDWLCDDFADFIERAGPRAELVLTGALMLATWLAPLSIGKRPPLSRLDVAQRCRALDTLEGTRAGVPLLALKAMLCTMYYEHPDARREIGVDAECRGDR